MDTTLMAKQLAAIIGRGKKRTLTVGAITVDCQRSNLAAEVVFSSFGESDRYKFSVVADYAVVGDVEKNSEATVDGKAYRVLNTDIDALDVGITLHLGAVRGQSK